MIVETKLILNEINATRLVVGNWASWSHTHKVSFCGWMDFHSDNGDGGATKDYKIFWLCGKTCGNHAKVLYS